MKTTAMVAALMLLGLATNATAAESPSIAQAVIADNPRDAAHPADLNSIVIRSHGSAMNGIIYTASGAGPHPTLLLLHGFPGNEQNTDLAQAARRAGWNVVIFHYRGSWGSEGDFSFAHCIEDAAAAVAWLRDPANAARFHIDAARIAVAGHSMGGNMAARTVADDPALLGAFLIDTADFAAIGRAMADPAMRRAFVEQELPNDIGPLAGTSVAALAAEVEAVPASLDLVAMAPALATRPLAIFGATHGLAMMGDALAAAASQSGAHHLIHEDWPTDHSFSDHRIALADRLVRWLAALPQR